MKNNIDISISRSLNYKGVFNLSVDWYENKKCYTFDRSLVVSSAITNNSTILVTYEYVITESICDYNDYNEYISLYLYFINKDKINFNTKLNLILPNYIENVKYYIKKIIRKIKRCTRIYNIKVKNINLGTTKLLY